jgi:O-antigen ligase
MYTRSLPLAFWSIPLWVVLTAGLVYGGDTPAASLLLSTGLLGFGALATLICRPSPSGSMVLAAILFAALVALGSVRNWTMFGAHEYAVLGAVGAVFWSARCGALTRDRADGLWMLSLLAGGLLAAFAFLDFLIDPALNFGRERPYHLDRLSAPFLSANTAATLYGSIALMACGEALRRSRHVGGSSWSRIIERAVPSLLLPALILMFAMSALFLTASRAGIALVLVLMPVLVVWDVASRRSGLAAGFVWGGGAVLAISIFFALSGDLFFTRIQAAGEDGTRPMMLQAYWQVAQDHLWLGTGLGSFEFINDRVASPDNATFIQFQGAAHNVYLQWILQAGILGAAAMFGLVGLVITHLFVGLRRRTRQRSYLRTIIIIIAFVAGHGLVDYAVEIPMMAWWLGWLAGLGFAISSRETAA